MKVVDSTFLIGLLRGEPGAVEKAQELDEEGGVATITGPAVGAFIMVGLQETFRSAFFGLAPQWTSQAHALVFGLLVIFVILFLSNGLVGDWLKIKRNVFRMR